MPQEFDPARVRSINKDISNVVASIAGSIGVRWQTPFDEGKGARRLARHLAYCSDEFKKEPAHVVQWMQEHDGESELPPLAFKLRGLVNCAKQMLGDSGVRRSLLALLRNDLYQKIVGLSPEQIACHIRTIEDPFVEAQLEMDPFLEYIRSPTGPPPAPAMLVRHIRTQVARRAYDHACIMAALPVYQLAHHQRGSVPWAHCLSVTIALLLHTEPKDRNDPEAVRQLCISMITARGPDLVHLIDISLGIVDDILASYDRPPAHFEAVRQWHAMVTRHFSIDIGKRNNRQQTSQELEDWDEQLDRVISGAPDDCVKGLLIEAKYDRRYRLAEYQAHDSSLYEEAFQLAHDTTTEVAKSGSLAMIAQGGLSQLKICVGNGDFDRAHIVIPQYTEVMTCSARWRRSTWDTYCGVANDCDTTLLERAWGEYSGAGMCPHTDSMWRDIAQPDRAFRSISAVRRKGRTIDSEEFKELRRAFGMLRSRQPWP